MPEILNDSRCPIKFAIGEEIRRLKKEDPDKLKEMLSLLSDEEAKEILYDDEIMLREKQWVDLSGPENLTLLLCGRGLV